MQNKGPLLPMQGRAADITKDSPEETGAETVATRDRDVIQRWAERRHAEPATGEGVLAVNDGGAPIRFNFPGSSRYRPLSWEEWFARFEGDYFTFVYEERGPDGSLSNRYRIVHADEWPGQLS
jgi:hypothetical protein